MVAAPDILFLAGPTASGKTALSLHAARRLDAEIINADSMQVYDRLAILSARPDRTEMAGIAHHLFGEVDPAVRCSVGEWSRRALACLEAVKARGKRAIFVGGTGLYFKALTEGLAPTPEISARVRDAVNALVAARGVEALREEAMRHDPVAASRVEPGDRQRLQRIVEIGREAGQALSALQADTVPLLAQDRWRGVVISPDRETLYERIETRFDAMMAAGALVEAEAIFRLELDRDLPAMKAVGLPPLLDHLAGELTLAEAVETAKRDSRRYAKRQYTWFANQHPGWARISSLDPDDQRNELNHFIDKEFGL